MIETIRHYNFAIKKVKEIQNLEQKNKVTVFELDEKQYLEREISDYKGRVGQFLDSIPLVLIKKYVEEKE